MIIIELILKNRGCGKTCDLILESSKKQIPIIVSTQIEKQRLIEYAKFLGVLMPFPMTTEECIDRKIYSTFKFNNGISKDIYLIDDVDRVLGQLLKAEIETVTCTPGSWEDIRRKNNMIGNNVSTVDFICSDLNRRINSNVIDVNIIVPDKVVEVTFLDGSKEKAVCQDPDTFSLETAISICILKKLLGGTKAYNDAIKNGIKVYKDGVKKTIESAKEAERIKNKRKKKEEYKKRRANRRREEQIEIQKEAYLRAIRETKNNKNADKEND